MPDPTPRNLRTVREIARTTILFSVRAGPEHLAALLVASNDNKVYELDASQANPTPGSSPIMGVTSVPCGSPAPRSSPAATTIA